MPYMLQYQIFRKDLILYVKKITSISVYKFTFVFNEIKIIDMPENLLINSKCLICILILYNYIPGGA